MANEKTMNVKVLHVNKTTAEWAAETTVISKGLLCIEFTTDGKVYAKVGDGVNTFANLPYLSDGAFDIADYYTSNETDAAISSAISALGNVQRIKGIKATYAELPTTDNKIGDVWFVGTADNTGDSFEEYIWTTNSKWEYLGKRQVETDLSGYTTTTTFNAHANNKSNPHGVTKEQVGLSNVENKSSATIRGELTKANVTTALGYTPPTTDTTYSDATTSQAGLMSASDKEKLDGIAAGANKYVHPTTAGNKHIPTGGESGQILKWSASGTATWAAEKDTTYSDMTGATASAAGTSGLVPAPAAGKQASYLRGDGTWAVPTNTTYTNATTSKAGLMSAEDKTALDTIKSDYIKSTDTLILNCSL